MNVNILFHNRGDYSILLEDNSVLNGARNSCISLCECMKQENCFYVHFSKSKQVVY